MTTPHQSWSCRGHAIRQVGGLSGVEQQRARVLHHHRILLLLLPSLAGVDGGAVHILVLVGGVCVDGLLQFEADPLMIQVAAVGINEDSHVRREVVRASELDSAVLIWIPELGLGVLGSETIVGRLVE